MLDVYDNLGRSGSLSCEFNITTAAAMYASQDNGLHSCCIFKVQGLIDSDHIL